MNLKNLKNNPQKSQSDMPTK